jgi:hypothetical protein
MLDVGGSLESHSVLTLPALLRLERLMCRLDNVPCPQDKWAGSSEYKPPAEKPQAAPADPAPAPAVTDTTTSRHRQ